MTELYLLESDLAKRLCVLNYTSGTSDPQFFSGQTLGSREVDTGREGIFLNVRLTVSGKSTNRKNLAGYK